MSEKKLKPKRSRAVTGLLGLACVGLVMVTLAGRLGRFWWLADSFSHFAVYLAVAGGGLCVMAAVFRRWRLFGVALLVLVVNGVVIWPVFVPGKTTAFPGGSVALRLAEINVRYKNHDRERVGEFLRGCDADIIFVLEVDSWWDRALRDMDVPYRMAVSRPREGAFGMSLLVHEALGVDGGVTLQETRVLELGSWVHGYELPAIEATLLLDGRRVRILGIHPPPPVSARHTMLRDTVLLRAKQWAREQTGPHVVIGDLNTTPWSYAFSILTGDGGLISTQDGRGNQGTWPTTRRVPWMIPIDHCLASKEWVCAERWIGLETGSDHLPLTVGLGLSAIGAVEEEASERVLDAIAVTKGYTDTVVEPPGQTPGRSR